MNKPKFCVNCKYCTETKNMFNTLGYSYILLICTFKTDYKIHHDPVTGLQFYPYDETYIYCRNERESGDCGKDGKNFEPKTEFNRGVLDET